MRNLIEKIRQTIKGTEFEGKTYIAGGFVRDLTLGRPNKDIDIVVCLPNGGVLLAELISEKLRGTNVVIFERFGTAQVVVDGIELEFVMTRKEEYDFVTRNPIVSFGTVEDDVMRRDFTVNSLLYNISTGVIKDLTGRGFNDLQRKLITTTDNAEIIFAQDPLRMLRAIRFTCKLGFNLDSEVLKQIKKDAPALAIISKERIQDEFMKILASDNAVQGIELLLETGLMDFIIPEFKLTDGMTQNGFHTKDVKGHILDVVANAKPTAKHRLAALLHDIGKVNTRTEDDTRIHFYAHEIESGKITERVMKDLKFSNEDIELIKSAVENHMAIRSESTKRSIRKRRMNLGDEKFAFLLDLCEADRMAHLEPQLEIINIARNLKASEQIIIKTQLPVNGNEIMEMFDLKPGKEVGDKLKLVEEMVLDDPTISREEIIKKLMK